MTFLAIALLLIQVQNSLHFGPKILDQLSCIYECIRSSFIVFTPMHMVIHFGLLDEFTARTFDRMSIIEPHESFTRPIVQSQGIGQTMRPGFSHVCPFNHKFHHTPLIVNDKHLSIKVKERIE